MLAAAGILFEDLLGHLGIGGPAAATPWFNAGENSSPACLANLLQV